MTVKYKFSFLLTAQYSKTVDAQGNLFWDDSWANWMTPGFYLLHNVSDLTIHGRPHNYTRKGRTNFEGVREVHRK
jgi:hypothetical protein